MKIVKVRLTRKVTYEEILKVTEEEFELIKDLDYDDVEMYDFKKAKNIGKGISTVPPNEIYNILEGVDSNYNEVDKEETMFDVSITEIKNK